MACLSSRDKVFERNFEQRWTQPPEGKVGRRDKVNKSRKGDLAWYASHSVCLGGRSPGMEKERGGMLIDQGERESPVTESLKGHMEELVLCSIGNEEPLEGFQIEE